MRNFPALLFIALCTATAHAAELLVPQDYAAIQAAIDAAQEGDTVLVSPGVYNEALTFPGFDLVLTSLDPTSATLVAATIIDGSNTQSSVITFVGTESSVCMLQGFTITKGRAHYGAGIDGAGTRATIRNNIIRENSAVRDSSGPVPVAGIGAGMFDCAGVIENNLIEDNHAAGVGGGIAFCDGVINSNVFVRNTGRLGGAGLYNCSGRIVHNIIRTHLINASALL